MKAACAPARPGFARCYALWGPQATVNRAIAAGITGAAATPKGWGAKDLESAYKLPVSRHPHQTVAVTIAYNTPHLAHYLAVYRKEYGLPPARRQGDASAWSTRTAMRPRCRPPARAAAGTWRSPWTFR